MKSRRSVDSPGTLTMELNGGESQAKMVGTEKKTKDALQRADAFEEMLTLHNTWALLPALEDLLPLLHCHCIRTRFHLGQ